MANTEIISRGDYTESDGSKSVSRMFHVDASSQLAALAIAKSEFDASVGETYIDAQGNQSDPDLTCVRVRARQLTPVPIGESGAWEVQADYEYGTPSNGQIAIPANGLARYRVETRTEWRDAVKDRFGNLITNTAGDLFESGAPQKLVCDDTLIVEFIRSYQNAIEAWAFTRPYVGKTNSAPYHGAPVHCMVLEDASLQQITTATANVLAKFVHTLRFRFKEQQPDANPIGTQPNRTVGGWDTVVLNLGRRVLTDDPLHPYRELRHGFETNASFAALPGQTWDEETPRGKKFLKEALIDYPMFLSHDGKDVLINPGEDNKYRVFEPIHEIDFNLLGV